MRDRSTWRGIGAGLLLASWVVAGCGDEGGVDAPPEKRFAYHELEELKIGIRTPGIEKTRMLTLKFSVELLTGSQDEAIEEITKRWHMIRHAIIVFLIDAPPENTTDKSNLDRVRKGVARVMNDNLDTPHVQRVLLKECYYQS